MIDPVHSQGESARAIGLRVHGLRLSWQETVLISELDFDAPARAWTCLLGESGVGKSTLLRTIAGLIPAAPGTRITDCEGKPVSARIAYMAQQDLLLPWLSAAENVGLGARLRGGRANAGHIRELLTRTGVAARADARPAQLSGGERQRVALARTLMEDRPIVLMDEPFSALDAMTRIELQDLAYEVLAERTVIMVTHDPFEALRLGTHIRVLRAGSNSENRAIVPPGSPLRDPTDPALREIYHDILARLGAPLVHGNGQAA